jgi:hypothetical protein
VKEREYIAGGTSHREKNGYLYYPLGGVQCSALAGSLSAIPWLLAAR